ncbi:TetR/AcrR family transcriptional regulator [Siccirubricoccus sp. KC 17139]|uniref:TetR/AcrR family transcriptional regulator n=1 Tax=Siccirubricoccus soli TaxID=2899147 RepID=A0ABT1D8G5_9PROT|nr:TetR/AcrR family transcriptional regulator [Siccirubricoccus soli]MCP2683685.1 TetR/AcrR family transcriptional regulator [Siccirubricoccus soli]
MSHENLLAAPRPRGRPRLEGAEDRALDAVIELLEIAPVQDITMERIAERAGLSKITLYRRWPSRLALFIDALLRRVAETQPLDESLPPILAIANNLATFGRRLNGMNGALARAVLGESLADPEMAHILRDRYLAHRRDAAIRLIGRGQADGSFAATGEAEELHDMLYGALWYRFLFGVGRFSEAVALDFMEKVLRPRAGWQESWTAPA